MKYKDLTDDQLSFLIAKGDADCNDRNIDDCYEDIKDWTRTDFELNFEMEEEVDETQLEQLKEEGLIT